MIYIINWIFLIAIKLFLVLINIKENEILSINFTNKSKSEHSDFLYLAGKRFKIINIERVVNIETIISTFMEDNDINIYIEEIN